MLVLFTLGLGMTIGAQIAGRVETRHTPAASIGFSQQVVGKASEIAALQNQIAGADATAKPGLEGSLGKLVEEQSALRKSELEAIEWQPLWGKPAAFAAIVLLAFILLFRDRSKRANGEAATPH
jgi:hypothetical protein